MRRFYELALWDRGEKRELGYFATKKEAEQARRLAKKYYTVGYTELQYRIADGIAGYEVIPHEWGMVGIVQAVIDYNKRIEQKDG